MKRYVQPVMEMTMIENESLICVSPSPITSGGTSSKVTAEAQLRIIEDMQADAETSEEDLW